MIIKILILVFAYLLGSIPWGFVFGKIKGIDIREHGSKNIGATNTGRVLGKKYAIYAYILDMLKGFIFVFLFRFEIISSEYMLFDPMIYGLAAVLGHTFPIYLKFRGGKAVATGGGVVFGYCPWLIVIGLLTFFITTYISRLVSLGSLVGATIMGIASFILYIIGYDPIFTFLPKVTLFFPIISVLIVIIIFIRHSSNITRIKHHEESTVNWRK